MPSLDFAGIFDLGTVWIRYPVGWSIKAYRPSSSDPSTGASLSAEWGGGGSLYISCQKGKPQTGRAVLRSDFNPPDENLVLQNGTLQEEINVSISGKNASLGPNAVMAFLTFMVETPFPRHVRVATRIGPNQELQGLYHMPTVGVQNVIGTIDRNGSPPKSIPEPPSDPFRVMKRWCS